MLQNDYFTNGITRLPCRRLPEGLTSVNLGKPDYEKAVIQHNVYVDALEKCGLEVTVLEPDDEYPDSVFVEDPAFVMKEFAVVTNPGAPSRVGETIKIRKALQQFYPREKVHKIDTPGILEGGDVMTAGTHCYIGISGRTNEAGAKHLIRILEKYGMSGTIIPVKKALHLKTGISYLDNNQLVVSGEFRHRPEFRKFSLTTVSSANCLWLNGKVLVIEGIPDTREKIEKLGYETIEIPFSEYLKLDGGLGCLSLRF